MFIISKQFHFSASHQLSHLPSDHQCARLHGHNYIVEVVLAAEYTDDRGFVRDYGELEPIAQYIKNELDHRHLNEVLGSPENTTAENLAYHLFWRFSADFRELVVVRVSETPKTWAEFRRPL